MNSNKLQKLLVALLILIGVCFFVPKSNEVKAASQSSTQVHYEKMEINTFRSGDEYMAPKPTADGFKDWIFAGWFKGMDEMQAISKTTTTGEYYAKFVPAEVLSVKCQVADKTNANQEENSKMRIISSIDSKRYNKVGFDIKVEGREEPINYESTSVAKSIVARNEGVDYNYSPNIFDLKSNYFITVTINNIPSDYFDKGFYIKPYWVTKDNTKVYGVERYARVEDYYLDIVNVPVRLYSDETVTSGTVEVDYDLQLRKLVVDTANVDAFTYESVDMGSLLSGVTVTNDTTNKKVICKLPNDAEATKADGMLVNLRFKMQTAEKYILSKTNTFGVKAQLQNAEGGDVAVVTMNSVYKYHNTEYTGAADTAWYTNKLDGQTEFVLTTPDELYGLSELVNEGKLTTQKIYLGADITVNTGIIVSKANDGTITINKTYDWTPIGSQGTKFAGTFDGQGHTISGLHTNASTAASNKMYVGLFGFINTTGTVKNFRITNSYFKASDYAASVAGCLESGTIENVYSEAYVETSATAAGGVVGISNGTGVSSIEKCWFKGTVTAKSLICGGIVGVANGKNNTKNIINCLNEGDVIGTQWVGGLVGRVVDSETVITNSLNMGNVSGTSVVGSIVGKRESTCTTNNVYALTADKTYAIGSDSANKEVTTFTNANKNSYYGYKALDVLRDKWDFDNTWVVRENNTPVLKAWCESGALYTPATTWAGGTGAENDPYIIKTASQLYKLANDVNNGTTYDNTFFKLGANITVNSGTASAWETNAPKYNWITIGKQAKQHFKGSFDGANYTIKGLYIVDTSTSVGLFVDPDEVVLENLKVTNSYLKGGTGTAAVVGWYGGGTFDSIYSDAIVVSTGAHGAGLVSVVDQADTTFTNCWFDGSLTTGDFSGGIVSCNTKNIQLTNCLNTGSVTSSGSTGQVGGIIGRAAGAVVMSDCLNTGKISGLKDTASIIGFNNYVTINVERVYALESSHELTCANDANVRTKVDKVTDVTGGNGYLNTYLSFDRPELPVPTTGEWVARKNNVPALKSLVSASDILPLDGNNMYRADTRWHQNPTVDEQGRKTYTIQTAEELVGFAKLVNDGTNFAGEVVSLGADITVNSETINSSTNKANVYQWTPIGTKGKKFSGTFDGQGHTLTGLYSDISNATDGTATSGYWYAGLFGTVNTTASIKDFSIKNSYFKANHYAGSVAGLLEAGTIENVYSEAIIETRLSGAGGIVGQITGIGPSSISRAWFKGTSTAGSYVSGGIVGASGSRSASEAIQLADCLNEGGIYGPKWLGGLVGNVVDIEIKITDCLNTGEVHSKTESGAAIGRIVSTCTSENVYAIGSLNAVGVGSAEISVFTNQSDLSGTKGYLNTYLTFERPELPVPTTGAWVVRKNAVPGLKSFVNADDILTLNGSNMYRADTRWHNNPVVDENDVKTYTIKTAEELIGFAKLVNEGTSFTGEVVCLGADITVNAKTMNSSTSKEDVYQWTPIGSKGKKFSGTFDGKGFTISGLYSDINNTTDANNTNYWYAGLFGTVNTAAFIKDFSIKNSYFKATHYAGSVVGLLEAGTIDSVYSEANVETGQTGAGGIVGSVKGVGACTVQNIWFKGTVTASSLVCGGIVGASGSTNAKTAQIVININNCLNEGVIKGTQWVGGLVGRIVDSETDITDCINVGTVTGTKEVGNAIGTIGSTCKTTNVYVLTSNNPAVGSGTVSGTAPTVCDDLNNYKGYMNTNLDFDNTWVAMENSAPVLQNFAPEEGKFDTTSWYVKAGDGVGTSEENPYLLDSVADMYGFAKRANASADGFAGKYFKLTSSVTFNEGNPTDGGWATTAPYYVWYPIGSNPNTFKGHFDGGMNTISGLYATRSYGTKNTTWYAGLFGYVTGATIKNVKVVDSYFSAEYAAAPIVGWMTGGEINNVYTNSITKTTAGYGGGIAGCLEGGTIQSVWFQGTVSGKDFAGGIVGVNTTTQAYIKHALSDGIVGITGGQAGGIIGRVNNALEVQDSLSMSTVTAANTYRGAIAGYVTNSGNLNMISSYGYCKANVTNGATALTAGKETNGVIGGQNYEVFNVIEKSYDTALAGKLDVTKWTFRVGNYPIPTSLAEGVVTSSDYSVPASKNAAYVIDTTLSGSGAENDPILITSEAELYGLAVLSQKEDFNGKTISLTSNITINTEDTTKENAIFYEWMPIGDRALPFAGSFEGNGNTISGLHKIYKSSEGTSWIGLFEMTADTSVISNFNIKNTYFAYTGDGDPTRIGSVAGEGYGTFDSIYSNATIKRTSGLGTGGILGVVHNSGAMANITNCWYDGEIISSQSGDAYIGGLIGFVYEGGTANVSHSLYSGIIQTDARKIGGVIGYVNSGGTLNVTDCLITGKLSGAQQVGIVAGRVKSGTDATSTLRINTTWGVNDVVSLGVGSTENAVIEGQTHISTAKDRFIGFIPDIDSTETLASQKADGEETGFDGWVMIKDGTPVLKSFVKADGIKTPSDVYEYTTVVSALNPNSSYTSWFTNTPEHEGDGNYLYTITGQSEEVYEAYCDALTSAFNLHSSNTIEYVKNHVFTAKNDDLVVDVTYSPTNTIYITVSTGKILSEHLTGAVNYSAKENAVADGYTLTGDNQLPNVTFHMVEQVEHLNGSGSSYIIQLKNGHLVVIDGGVNLQAPYLFDYMKSLVKEDGKKPVIEAWIISHPHRDHIGVFQTIWEDAYKTGDEYKNYAGQVYVNGIYFNEPSDTLLTRYNYGDREFLGYLKQAATLLKTSTNGTPNFYRMQTGQRYTFDDVTMDIMLSQELLSIADYDATADVNNCVQTDAINDTSTWCMFTIGTGNNAKKLLTAGDASYSGKNYMCDMYSMNYLTMDVMTALHHGFNTNLSKYSNMDLIFQDADLQEEFSQHISVKSVVLYSYKHNMTKKEDKITYWNGVEYVHAVNRKYARLNASFIDYLASKSNSFSNGIAVSQNGNTTNRNYLYSGEGTSVLTFGNTITAELKTKISE